jgi:hypothetical protein
MEASGATIDIFKVAEYFGITPDKITPIIVVLVFGLCLFYRYFLKDRIKEIETKIEDILQRVSRLEGIGGGMTSHSSPLSPTELGAQHIKQSNLEKILNDNKESFIKNVKDLLPKDYTDYDVQQIAEKFLVSLKDDPMMKPVKEYAFKNGLGIEVLLGTAALWLRDDFLKVSRQISKEIRK